MKTKTWLRISMITTIPMFITALCNMIVGISLWGNPHQDISKFNYPFMFWASMISFLCISVYFMTVLDFSRHANDVDDLEKAKQDYVKATQEMKKVRDKYTALLAKDK